MILSFLPIDSCQETSCLNASFCNPSNPNSRIFDPNQYTLNSIHAPQFIYVMMKKEPLWRSYHQFEIQLGSTQSVKEDSGDPKGVFIKYQWFRGYFSVKLQETMIICPDLAKENSTQWFISENQVRPCE